MEGKVTNNLIVALYRTDFSASIHIRAMAKLLGTSHVALLPYLKRLEELKILCSEKTGKNKQYTLNKDNILTKYYLVVTEELATIDYLERNFVIKKFAEHLAGFTTTSPLILFGSYAKDYATEESDIDLFCLGKIPENQTSQIEKFELTFGKKINVKTTTIENFDNGLRTGDILIKEIVKNHIILLNADAFVTLLWRYYTER
jgi:predicted nucleotidyltransferase